MLSYQHLYHAGNMADVHKHALLAWCLAYLTRKDKPLFYIETHAGRGTYDLDAAEAAKTGEAKQGIDIAEEWFAPTHPYAAVLSTIRTRMGPRAYPGSPLIAAEMLRADDKIALAELHPQENAALRQILGHRADIHRQDGAQMALSLCPPMPRRGMLLIDPSYEVKSDYAAMAKLVGQIHRKWPVGVIALWYPLLEGAPHAAMIRALPDGAYVHEVRFPPAHPGHRMSGSGMAFLNAPWGIEAESDWLGAQFAAHLARSESPCE